MKVSEAIEFLAGVDPDTEIVMFDPGCGCCSRETYLPVEMENLETIKLEVGDKVVDGTDSKFLNNPSPRIKMVEVTIN